MRITIRQIRDVAAQESPGDRVPVFGAFDSSDPVAGGHVFHRNLYSPSRDYWRRLGRPDCCCRIRVLQPLPRIFRQTAKAAGHLKARKGRLRPTRSGVNSALCSTPLDQSPALCGRSVMTRCRRPSRPRPSSQGRISAVFRNARAPTCGGHAHVCAWTGHANSRSRFLVIDETAYNEGPNPIAFYRERAGLSQEELAAQCGLTVDYLNR